MLARILENREGKEGRLWFPWERKKDPWNGRWMENRSKLPSFAKCGPFSSLCWINYGTTTIAPVFIILLCITARMASHGSEYQVYDSMLLTCFSILVKIRALPHSWQISYVESFWPCSAWAILWLGWDYMWEGDPFLSPSRLIWVGITGHGYIPCDLALSWSGLGIKIKLIPSPLTLNSWVPMSVISIPADWLHFLKFLLSF